MLEVAALFMLVAIAAVVAVPILIAAVLLKVVFEIFMIPMTIVFVVLKTIFIVVVTVIAASIVIPIALTLIALMIPVLIFGGVIAVIGLMFSIFGQRRAPRVVPRRATNQNATRYERLMSRPGRGTNSFSGETWFRANSSVRYVARRMRSCAVSDRKKREPIAALSMV